MPNLRAGGYFPLREHQCRHVHELANGKDEEDDAKFCLSADALMA
jgi:hypothetical protein